MVWWALSRSQPCAADKCQETTRATLKKNVKVTKNQISQWTTQQLQPKQKNGPSSRMHWNVSQVDDDDRDALSSSVKKARVSNLLMKLQDSESFEKVPRLLCFDSQKLSRAYQDMKQTKLLLTVAVCNQLDPQSKSSCFLKSNCISYSFEKSRQTDVIYKKARGKCTFDYGQSTRLIVKLDKATFLELPITGCCLLIWNDSWVVIHASWRRLFRVGNVILNLLLHRLYLAKWESFYSAVVVKH